MDMGTVGIAAPETQYSRLRDLSFVRVLVLPHKQFLQMQAPAMNIPSSSSGHRPHETVEWTSSDPPRLPKQWAYLLPFSTQEVELWGSSLLALLAKELVIRYSAMGNPNARDVVGITEQATNTAFVASVVQELAGMETRPDKALANTWMRNFLTFVFEEYGFGGARAWACHVFEARIKDLCKQKIAKEGK